jgi:diguanylate cyclase (GGDEF)-like protein
MMGRKSFTTDAAEMVSLSERMGYLQALRAGFAVVVLASAVFASTIVGASLADLTLATAGYLALAGGAEALRRMGRGRGLPVVAGMLLADGAYLALAMYSTGGTQSPLRFLVYMHLVAVALLASYRTGLKIALWHSLLFFVVFYAQAAGIIDPNESASVLSPQSAEFTRTSVFNVMAFWLVAIGTAAFSSLNERELRRRKGDLEDLAAMGVALQDESEPQGLAQVLLDSVGDSFGFKRGLVLGSPDKGSPLLAYRGPGEATTAGVGTDEALLQAGSEKRTLLIKKLDEQANPGVAAALPFARNLVVVPLIAEGEQVGSLILEYPNSFGSRIERRVVLMVNQFASHAALGLRNTYLIQEVQRMADTDGLTGLANRRTFETRLEQELSRASRNGEPVTLMMVDVDHFKKFNDTYGHQAGDDVLKLVGGALDEASRDFDIPARYGGEEFAVILPACPSRESLVVAERLRAQVCQVDALAPVTASAGVATFPTHASDVESLIKAADEALYESKRLGRDRLTRSRRRARAKSAIAIEVDQP